MERTIEDFLFEFCFTCGVILLVIFTVYMLPKMIEDIKQWEVVRERKSIYNFCKLKLHEFKDFFLERPAEAIFLFLLGLVVIEALLLILM